MPATGQAAFQPPSIGRLGAPGRVCDMVCGKQRGCGPTVPVPLASLSVRPLPMCMEQWYVTLQCDYHKGVSLAPVSLKVHAALEIWSRGRCELSLALMHPSPSGRAARVPPQPSSGLSSLTAQVFYLRSSTRDPLLTHHITGGHSERHNHGAREDTTPRS